MISHFQKLITVAAFSLFASNVSASALCSYDNFYVGANVAAVSLIDKQKTENPILDKHRLSSIGVAGGGLIGYDFTLRNRVKLGLEGFAEATNLHVFAKQNYAPVSSYDVKIPYSLGLRLLPGYEWTCGTVVHAILGYASGKFKVKDDGDFGLVNTNFRKSGFQFGLGMKTLICRNFSIRTDLLYTIYSHQDSHGVTTSVPPGIQIYHNKLKTFEGSFSLIYKFN